jgi:hypothetical protein
MPAWIIAGRRMEVSSSTMEVNSSNMSRVPRHIGAVEARRRSGAPHRAAQLHFPY